MRTMNKLYSAPFEGGPLDGLSLSVEVGQTEFICTEVLEGNEVKHLYVVSIKGFRYNGIEKNLSTS
jgi:hypothetical protein